MVDVEEIKKVVLNLILNALDAIDEKGTVEVESSIDGENVYIRIKDNGYGMTEEFINNRLFKPFSTTKKKGLGIGLYQCKQVIEAHGGKIEANSEVGKGSVFTVFLPVSKETECVM
jgi:signal transduction histidine kinase